MTTSAPIVKPTSDKGKAIVAAMRKRIVAGEWRPGTQLPIRAKLEQAFGVSAATMQKALDQLNRDGFTHGKRRWGTFVTENPPHLSRYGLVFPSRPATSAWWVRFWTALINEAAGLEQSRSRSIPVFYGIERHSESEDYRQLLRDIRHQRLAGLIFPSAPFMVTDTPVVLEPGFPRVAIMDPDERFPQVTPLSLDWRSFFVKAAEYLGQRGRRRIAVLAAPNQQGMFAEYLQQSLAAWKLQTHPHWLQEVSQTGVQSARACVSLLLHGRPGERPDGLIITDDNLVEYGVAGAVDAGVRVGKDVDVVAHCNFPWPAPQGMAIKRLGFDARGILERSIEIIDSQRRGEPGPGTVAVSAVFEEELSTGLEAAAADRRL